MFKRNENGISMSRCFAIQKTLGSDQVLRSCSILRQLVHPKKTHDNFVFGSGNLTCLFLSPSMHLRTEFGHLLDTVSSLLCSIQHVTRLNIFRNLFSSLWGQRAKIVYSVA